MQKSYRFLVSILFLGAYLLSACSGAALPQQDDSAGSPGSSQTQAVFTGTVESMGGTQWLISGQQVGVDDSTSVDPNVKVGDIVKVEANVSQDGIVLALKIESSKPDDVGANDNVANANDSNSNDDNANVNDNTNTGDDNSNGNVNGNANDNTAPAGPEQEMFGVVEAITTDSITIGGVAYSLASFTEFKNLIAVGDQVKIHVIVNADGTLTIREIEKSGGAGIGDDNSNSNDDNSNFNDNGNGNDDDKSGNSNDDSNHNSNSNSNDNDDDNDGNSNSNDND